MAQQIEKWQVKAIYALGGSLQMVQRASHDDGLHELVHGITGKESVKSLTREEAACVIHELQVRMKGFPAAPKPKRKPAGSSAGMTGGQQKKVWALMYQLQRLSPSQAGLGDRLCGVIGSALGIDAKPADPFQWLDYRKGNQLIETLKGYIQSAERQAERGGRSGTA